MPNKKSPASKKTATKKKKEAPKPWAARSEETGDKVFLVLEKQRRWIVNPFTLRQLGFDFADVEYVDYEKLIDFEETQPIDLTEPGSVNPLTNKKSKGLPQSTQKPKKSTSPQPTSDADTSKPHKVWS